MILWLWNGNRRNFFLCLGYSKYIKLFGSARWQVTWPVFRVFWKASRGRWKSRSHRRKIASADPPQGLSQPGKKTKLSKSEEKHSFLFEQGKIIKIKKVPISSKLAMTRPHTPPPGLFFVQLIFGKLGFWFCWNLEFFSGCECFYYRLFYQNQTTSALPI